MAFSGTLRRAASRAAPIAARVFPQAPRSNNYHSAAIAAVSRRSDGFSSQIVRRSAPSALRFFSDAPAPSDKILVNILKDEIKYAEESVAGINQDELPESFPFKLEDQPGQSTVTLTRTYQDEQITVEVSIPNVTGNEEGASDDDVEHERSELPLLVSVAKDGGLCLEFGCTAYPDEIAIDSLSVKDPNSPEDQVAYEGPDFSDLDDNLQKAFLKYLEIRGIRPSTTNPLHEYMFNKDSKEYVVWLKSLKSFVEA